MLLEPDSKLPIRTFRSRQASHDDESRGDLQPDCRLIFHIVPVVELTFREMAQAVKAAAVLGPGQPSLVGEAFSVKFLEI